MSIQDHYNQYVDIYRFIQLEEWGASKEWIRLHENVPALCRLLSGRERIVDEGKELIADYKFYHDENSVSQIDRYVWNDEVYEILEIKDPNERDHHLEVRVKQLPPGTLKLMDIES